MRYVSTRGQAPELGFEEVLLTGLARDGGLYVPTEWPRFDEEEIASMAGKPYTEVAYRVMAPFIGDEISETDLRGMIEEAYGTFGHDAVAPLSQIGPSDWLLELYHGPTLAFKDVAMQILARLFDHALAKRKERVTIVGATSGDTGSAAIEAFRGRDTTDIFILHPKGRVSEVQRRQMTTVLDSNVHNIAVDGTFDDCQALVKDMFNDHSFRDEINLAGVNSINWGRVMAQIVYYFTSAVALGAPERALSYSVPTGNFGDVFAGYVAARMGLPLVRLVVATNTNDILARALTTGRYDVGTVVPTISPSMDIQVSSNFERLLFDMYGRDGGQVTRMMEGLKQSGGFSIDEPRLSAANQVFAASRTSEDDTKATIKKLFEDNGRLIDPHTAVGVFAAEQHRGHRRLPMVTLSTAHPAKFPAAVEEATGQAPALPARMQDLFNREERLTSLPNDLAAIQTYIRKHNRMTA